MQCFAASPVKEREAEQEVSGEERRVEQRQGVRRGSIAVEPGVSGLQQFAFLFAEVERGVVLEQWGEVVQT
jgi:hypothetical protein